MDKFTIELGEKELRLISNALDIYSRLALGQFEIIDQVSSLQEEIWKNKDLDWSKMKEVTDNIKTTIWPELTPNSYWGIFNREHVHDDARIAGDLHQQIRHHFYLQDTDPDKPKYTVDAYPSDICKIAGLKSPEFKINS